MAEIARRTPTTLRAFMDRADWFINAKNTLKALTAPRRTKMEKWEGGRAKWEATTSRGGVRERIEERRLEVALVHLFLGRDQRVGEGPSRGRPGARQRRRRPGGGA